MQCNSKNALNTNLHRDFRRCNSLMHLLCCLCPEDVFQSVPFLRELAPPCIFCEQRSRDGEIPVNQGRWRHCGGLCMTVSLTVDRNQNGDKLAPTARPTRIRHGILAWCVTGMGLTNPDKLFAVQFRAFASRTFSASCTYCWGCQKHALLGPLQVQSVNSRVRQCTSNS